MQIGRYATGTGMALTVLLSSVAVALGAPPFTTAQKSSHAGGGQAELYSLTVACHSSFDRVVIRGRLATPDYSVAYASQIVQPSGLPLSLEGTARLRVDVRPARGHSAGGTSLLPAVLTPHCPSLRQVKRAEDFEGVVVLGLGIRGTKPFRAFRLTRPTRIVVDISH